MKLETVDFTDTVIYFGKSVQGLSVANKDYVPNTAPCESLEIMDVGGIPCVKCTRPDGRSKYVPSTSIKGFTILTVPAKK